MSNEAARINNVSIKKGDIVQIKFKKIEEIIEFYKNAGFRAADVFQNTAIDGHMTSVLNGGFFHVKEIETDQHNMSILEVDRINRKNKGYKRPDEVTIIDHNGDDEYFTFNENLIESIEVRDDVGEHYFSDKFQLSLLKIDGLLLINGVAINKHDKDLINILEKTIADMSIRSMLEESEDKDEKEEY